jgi:hypothetical protein
MTTLKNLMSLEEGWVTVYVRFTFLPGDVMVYSKAYLTSLPSVGCYQVR